MLRELLICMQNCFTIIKPLNLSLVFIKICFYFNFDFAKSNVLFFEKVVKINYGSIV